MSFFVLQKGEAYRLGSIFHVNKSSQWLLGIGCIYLKTCTRGFVWIQSINLEIFFFFLHFYTTFCVSSPKKWAGKDVWSLVVFYKSFNHIEMFSWHKIHWSVKYNLVNIVSYGPKMMETKCICLKTKLVH